MRQNANRRARNRWRKGLIKEAVRDFEQALATDKQKATQQLSAVFSRLDKVAAKGTIHKNAAARKKSRLAKRLNKLAAQA
jgi:small subunit ribosomal protein S20